MDEFNFIYSLRTEELDPTINLTVQSQRTVKHEVPSVYAVQTNRRGYPYRDWDSFSIRKSMATIVYDDLLVRPSVVATRRIVIRGRIHELEIGEGEDEDEDEDEGVGLSVRVLNFDTVSPCERVSHQSAIYLIYLFYII